MTVWGQKCEKSFPHRQALDQHLTNAYVHNYCLVCQRDFVTYSALAQHKANSSYHNICGKCGKEFVDADDLDDHIDEYHWYCQRCGVFADSEDKLVEHHIQSSAHRYCGPCRRDFSSASNLSSVNQNILVEMVQSSLLMKLAPSFSQTCRQDDQMHRIRFAMQTTLGEET